jgi:hypothetical protein
VKLRIYAVVVTLALIAALTNPSEENHYAKLQSLYPWVEESLLATAQMRYRFTDASREQTAQTLWPEWLQNNYLSYRDYGIASAVVACLLSDPCPIGGEKCSLISLGFFGFVLPLGEADAIASLDEIQPPARPTATPSAEVVDIASEERKDANGAASAFFAAYKNYQNAERMLREGQKEEAKTMLSNVLQELDQIKAQDPDWQPLVIDFRLKKTRQYLDSLTEVEP